MTSHQIAVQGVGSMLPINECTVYAKASVNERWDMVLDYRACWCCLKRGHRQAECYNIKECGVDGCQAKHHKTLNREKEDQQSKKREGDTKRPTAQKSDSQISSKAESYPVSHAANDGSAVKVCLLQLMEVKAGDDG